MRRGFKSLAEKRALEVRRLLNVSGLGPIDPWGYAEHLKVSVLDLAALELPIDVVHQLTVVDGDSWSAMTLEDAGNCLVVLNPTHAITRRRNDLMHELAHIELRHTPARVDVSELGLFLLSDYSDEQEQEADWHAAALLVPRDGLVKMRARGKSVDEIAVHYGVSSSLCEWRLRMTGVDVQLGRRR